MEKMKGKMVKSLMMIMVLAGACCILAGMYIADRMTKAE